MKKYKILSYLLPLAAVILGGCYSDTVDSFSNFTVQVPIYFHSDHFDKAAPDTSLDFVNLNDYSEYTDNKAKIDRALVYQFNYCIDSLVIDEGVVYDPAVHTIQFDFIRFYLVFAKGNGFGGYTPDYAKAKYLLGEYLNVDVRDYFRTPKHIIEIGDDLGSVISQTLKENPQFFIVSEYSREKNQTGEFRYFPFVRGRYDLVIRLKVKI